MEWLGPCWLTQCPSLFLANPLLLWPQFKSLYGSFDGNKNTVISGVQWELTGNVVEKGTFQNGKKW